VVSFVKQNQTLNGFSGGATSLTDGTVENFGDDEDASSSLDNHSYSSNTKLQHLHSDDAYSICNKALQNHNYELVIGVQHEEHAEMIKSRERNIYYIVHPIDE